MQYDLNADPLKRDRILETLWQLIKWQAICQGLSFVGGMVNRTVARRITHGLQLRVYAELLNKDISLFDQHKTGELAKCVEDRVSNLAAVVGALIKGLPAMLKVPLTLYEMWNTSPALTQANGTLIFSVVGGVISLYFLCLKSVSEQIETCRAAASSCITESFVGIRTIQSFTAGNQFLQQYSRLLQAPGWLQLSRDLMVQGIVQVLRSFETLITVSTYIAGTRIMAAQAQCNGQRLQVEELVRFQYLCGQLFGSLFATAGMANAFGSAAGDVAACETILGSNPHSTLQQIGGTLDSCTGELVLSDVSFSYPATDEHPKSNPVLRELSLCLRPGEVTALVGKSGCGKSTVLSLLQRFHNPSLGSVLLDSTNLSELDARWLRQQMGKVEQEPLLFALSIRENIRLGKPDATSLEVEQAAIQAQAHAFILECADGYDTMISEQGQSLSGGQRQRIAIARALLMKPKVLLLDEATSALDGETERNVMQAMGEVMRGRTTILIAHRLSTVASADRIVVLDGGRVAESGNHRELIARNGIYAELVRSQQQSITY